MTLEAFTKQVERLKSTFGERHYTEERALALYHELKGTFNEREFEVTVSYLILNARHAPLLPEFQEAKSKLEQERRERDRMAAQPVQAIGSLDGVPSDGVDREFVALCKRTLSDYTTGKLTKAQFAQACDLLDDAALSIQKAKSAAPCPSCAKTGLVFRTTKDGYSIMFRCECSAGQLQPREFVWRDRSGFETTKPFHTAHFRSTPQVSYRDRAAGVEE